MAVSGSKTNYVKMTASGDVHPLTAKLQGNTGGPGVAPADWAGINLGGIVIRKSTGVIGKINIQAAYWSGTTLAYADILPSTTFATSVGVEDFWHMPEGGGGMSPLQIKATLLSNMSIVLLKR